MTQRPNKRGQNADDNSDRQLRLLYIWLRRRLIKAEPTNLVLAITSIFLLLATIGQGIIAWKNYEGTAPLVEYARRSTEASERFAVSAEQIRDGVGDAVEKLQTQANQATRQATAVELAAKTSVAANSLNKEVVAGKLTISWNLASPIAVGRKLDVCMTFKNEGSTAIDIQERSKVEERNYPLTGEMPISDAELGDHVRLSPGGHSSKCPTLPHVFTEQDIKLIDSGQRPPLIFGRGYYTSLGVVHPFMYCVFPTHLSEGSVLPKGETGEDPQHVLRQCPIWHSEL